MIFFLLTKMSALRLIESFENVFFNVMCKNQKLSDGRIPIILDLPLKHKGIITTPLLCNGCSDCGKYEQP